MEGFEVVQAVQDEANGVKLVADKATVVRVYFRVEGTALVRVRGRLELSRPGAATVTIDSLNIVAADPTDNGQLLKKRSDLQLGLNFLLPVAMIAVGATTLRLVAAFDGQTGGPIDLLPAASQTVQFLAGPPLRLRLLGIRYKLAGSSQTFAPTTQDVNLTLSWLRRAYPVPRVEATYAVIDSNLDWPFAATDVNLQLAAVRSLDVAAGTDARTHYYGLVHDNNTNNQFLRGRAAGIPATADPSVVACGPTGASSFGWDFDGSYGDWYTGHELAHTLGRAHPGFCAGNSRDDLAFPYPNGQLSGSAPRFVGFDLGDAAAGVAMAALPGAIWHDVMTYCDNQWLSAYTYEAIRLRLLAEDALPAGATPPAAPGSAPPSPTAPTATSASGIGVAAMTASPQPLISVIGAINLDQKTGRIRYVLPVAAESPKAAAAGGLQAMLMLKDPQGRTLAEAAVPVSIESCDDAGLGEQSGIVNAVIPSHSAAATLELWFEGRRLDTYQAAARPTTVANIRKKEPPSAGLESLAMTGTQLTWDSPEADDPGVTYTVQVRRTPQERWQTISVGRPTPEVSIDPSQFAPRQKLEVRVTATNGFTTTEVAQREIELD